MTDKAVLDSVTGAPVWEGIESSFVAEQRSALGFLGPRIDVDWSRKSMWVNFTAFSQSVQSRAQRAGAYVRSPL